MRVTPLVDNVYVLDFEMVQAYLCRDADRLTLVDTGIPGYGDAILDAVRDLGLPPAALHRIVLTHCHGDHRGSLADVAERTGAEVVAHRLDAPAISGDAPEPDLNITERERPFYDALRARMASAPPATHSPVHREVDDGDEIDLFGGARIIGMPGHTPGSIAVFAPRERMLFTGDAVVAPDGTPIAGVFNVDGREAARSFRKVSELEFDIACFGHGAPLAREAALVFRRAAERQSV